MDSKPIIPTPPPRCKKDSTLFTLRRLGIGGTLAKTLTNTNCIESMISIPRRTTAHHRTGDQVEGRLDGEALDPSRHARGRALVLPGPRHTDMKNLVAALRKETAPIGDAPAEHSHAAA